MSFKALALTYRHRGGVKYRAADYGLTKSQADRMVKEYRDRGVLAFREKDRYVGDSSYFVFAAE